MRRFTDGGVLRILHVIDHWGLGGAQRALADLVRHDAQHEHGIAAVFEHHSQKWEVGPKVPLLYLAKSYLGILGACGRLRRLIKEWQPDLIQVHLNGARFICAFSLWGLRKKPLVIWHEHSGRELKALYGPFLGYFLMGWQRLLLRHVAHVVGNSKNTLTYIQDHLGVSQERRSLIHCLVDTKQIRNLAEIPLKNIPTGVVTERPVVGFVGRLAMQKGPDDLLAVARALRDSNHPAQLWVVGDGPQRNYLEREVQAAGLQDDVLFWGLREDVYAVMKAMDVVLMPSRYEPFGLVAMEAFILGKPVVAYAVDGLAEVLQLGFLGHAVSPGDEEALIQTLFTVLEGQSSCTPAIDQHPFEPTTICEAWHQLYLQVRQSS